MLHEAGLAYQKEALVNWDPVDKTVLANEQVDTNGCSWRSGAKVEQRDLKQWFLAITKFAPDLLAGLDTLEKNNSWPSRVIDMQRNWLGSSEGVEFELDVWRKNDLLYPTEYGEKIDTIRLYTTRLDTLHGAQFVALSLKHPLVQAYAAENAALRDFIKAAQDLPPDSKAGFKLPHLKVKSNNWRTKGFPIPKFLKRAKPISLPVYAAPYVLDTYGTGAVMGVPAHDTRDWAFWEMNEPGKPVRFVVAPEDKIPDWDRPFTAKGILCHPNDPGPHPHSDDVIPHIIKALREAGHDAIHKYSWRLRDWLISRQRYWGAPIPITHCPACGAVPVPAEDLPVELPKLSPDQFHGRTGNPLEKIDEWVNVQCPKCNGPAKRDTDTMDTFMDSAWYFFRFADSKNKDLPFDPAIVKKTLPVNFYIGGVEHAILHLLYARFIAKFLASALGKHSWPTETIAEPFNKLVAQGMVHGKTYSDPATGRFLRPNEVDLTNPKEPKMVSTGETPNISFEKMSKSKYNGVDPTSCINKYGADVTRAHMLFAAPESEILEWEEERIAGITRWLQRVWRLVQRAAPDAVFRGEDARSREDGAKAQAEEETAGQQPHREERERGVLRATKVTLNSVTAKLDAAAGLNTVISDLIKLTGQIQDAGLVDPSIRLLCTETLVKMMAPLTPAFAEEAWTALHPDEKPISIFESEWPDLTAVQAGLVEEMMTCVLTVDGKRKFDTRIPIVPDLLPKKEWAEWVKNQLLKTDEGKAWNDKPSNYGIMKRVERVVVGKNGGILNLVTRKEKKEGKKE
jgi:leucyl-tRNA synthetase